MILCSMGCQNDNQKKSYRKNRVDKSEQLPLTLIFPDTVYKGVTYNGEIKYKNCFDTITKQLRKNPTYRDMVYAYIVTDSLQSSENYLKQHMLDTAWATSTKHSFEEYYFQKTWSLFF